VKDKEGDRDGRVLNLFVLNASTKMKDKVKCRLLLDVVLRDDAFANEDLLTSTKMNDERGCDGRWVIFSTTKDKVESRLLLNIVFRH
jgi:hypothetical protein